MEMVANGHDLPIFQNGHPNINLNNHEGVQQLRARRENGHAQGGGVRPQGAAKCVGNDLTLNSWQRILFPYLLVIIHTIYRYVVSMIILLSRLRRKMSVAKIAFLSNVVPGWHAALEVHTLTGFKELRHLADTTLTKKPLHIAFAFLEDHKFSYCDIAKLVTWCIAIGVRNITLYDIAGKLKCQKKRLYGEISQLTPLDVRRYYMFKWGNYPNNDSKNKNSEMDLLNQEIDLSLDNKQKSVININILSEEDGQGDFSTMTKALALMVKSGEVKADLIDENMVASHLKGNKGLPDPELLIRFGLTSSNLGFLPWHIRLTEIHDLHTHFDIEFGDFIKILYQYSNCEQRFGI